MDENEIDLVARVAYEQGTGASDWCVDVEGMAATQAHWRGIVRAVLAALDQLRQDRAPMERAQQARMISELSDLAHHGEAL